MSQEKTKLVLDSLSELLRTLAFISYQATEDSGDYNQPGSGGRRGVYKQYWENEYQFIFFSAFYTVSADLRKDRSLSKMAKAAAKLYGKILADKDACDEAYREHKSLSERFGGLRVHDGDTLKKPNAMTLRQLLPLMRADKVLVGWERGLPPHLSRLGDSPVLK